jgi:hypothetical protein
MLRCSATSRGDTRLRTGKGKASPPCAWRGCGARGILDDRGDRRDRTCKFVLRLWRLRDLAGEFNFSGNRLSAGITGIKGIGCPFGGVTRRKARSIWGKALPMLQKGLASIQILGEIQDCHVLIFPRPCRDTGPPSRRVCVFLGLVKLRSK